MAQSEKSWHICNSCLNPLASELHSIACRCRRFFDVAKADRLAEECDRIQEDVAYCDDRLTEAQRKRKDELMEQMRAQTKPPRASDVDSLYQDYRIEMAVDWLKFSISVEFANDFKRTLLDAKKRFSALEFKACQILNGDEGKEATIQVRYAIQRLIDRHYEILREEFPGSEDHPGRDELPDDLRAFEVEILDEYTEIEKQLRETGKYLRRVSALVRSKESADETEMGVSLYDAAIVIEEGDDLAAIRLVKKWSDTKKITATPIGKCPNDARRTLYRLSEILSDLQVILSFTSKEKTKYRKALAARLHSPREP